MVKTSCVCYIYIPGFSSLHVMGMETIAASVFENITILKPNKTYDCIYFSKNQSFHEAYKFQTTLIQRHVLLESVFFILRI